MRTAAPRCEPIRLSTPIKLDGQLDEAVYATTPSFTDFFQMEPVEGQVATEKTEGWLFFDEDAIYVTFRCWESRPDALVANEMRRDNNNIFQNDHIAFLIDPFYDRRNGLEFAINPIGGRWDGQITNERQFNADWNPVWDLSVGRFEGGWTVELVIPFKSLRYRPGRAQIWGFNARRVNKGEERNILSHEAAARARTARALSVVARINGRRPRSTAWIPKPRDQAVRRLRPDERRQRDSGRLQRCVGRHRR